MPGVPLIPADFGEKVAAGFTSRAGGVSAAPYASLNLGRHVGDDPLAVQANRAALAATIGVPVDRLCFMEQVHSSDVLTLDSDQVVRRMTGETEPLQADGMVTALPGVALGVLVADCLPVLFADAPGRVVGVAHAGRLGLSAGVVQSVVWAMCRLGSRPGDIRAVIGPAVCGPCYEVPEAIALDVEATVPGSLVSSSAGTPALDLRAGARRLLLDLGLASVALAGGCTRENGDQWFSYRRDGATGRLAGVVVLR